MQHQNNQRQGGMASDNLYEDDIQETQSGINCCSLCGQYVCTEFCESGKFINLFGGTLLSMGSAGLKIGSVFLLNKFVSNLAASSDTASHGTQQQGTELVMEYTAMLVAAELCSFLASWCVDKPIVDVSQKIALRLIEPVIKLPMTKFNELMLQDPSGLLATIPYNMKSLILRTTVEGIPNTVQILGVAIASVLLFGQDIIIVEAVLGVIYLGMCYKTAQWMHQAEKGYSSAMRFAYRMEIGQEDYLLTTKVFNAYKFEKETAENIYDRLAPLKSNLDNIERTSSRLQQVILYIGTGFLLAITANAVLDPNRPQFTMENFIAITVYFQLFIAPLVQIGQSFLEVSIHLVAMRRIAAISGLEEEILDNQEVTPLQQLADNGNRIVFREVCFRYPAAYDSTYIVNHLSFTLNPGQTLALVGSSGIGKSTVLKLILRLFDISDGVIEIGNTQITDCGLSQLRRRIGYIEQKTKIFYKDSMKTNLAYGSTVSDARIDTVLSDTQLLTKAKRESRYFHDHETGQHPNYAENKMFFLSGGEALKVGISRALQEPKDIYLLDEPTASLDAVNAHQILQQLSQLLLNKTSIIISHQLLHMISADILIYVHDFSLPGQPPHVHYFKGTHQELLNRNSQVYQNYLVEYPAYIREFQRLHLPVLSAQEYANTANEAYRRGYSLQSNEQEYAHLFSTNRLIHFQTAHTSQPQGRTVQQGAGIGVTFHTLK